MRVRWLPVLMAFSIFLPATASFAGGGPLGIDHKLSYDDSGIWNRNNQNALLWTMVVGEFTLGVWEGGETAPRNVHENPAENH